jgi:hypothetical protein
MDFRTSNRTARSAVAPLLSLFLLVAGSALAEPTVWLVRPLYPGQDALVERTEQALSKLMPGEARNEAIIGMKELSAALKGKSVEQVPCFSGDERCADPIDRFVAGLGFERVVLIQGGQDEVGFQYRVVAYEPKTGKTLPASATNANLEKALLGAVAKVVPAASTLRVNSTPPGATVFVDGVKVGVTPVNTQVLPGERVVRIDLKLHQPVEETLIIPIRGEAKLEKALEKVAARIVITASPPGADISIDGTVLGKDKVDRGIEPGTHVVRITKEQYKAFEQTITVKADEQFVLDKSLEPIAGPSVVVAGPGKAEPQEAQKPPPPPPLTETEKSYELKSYFHASYEFASLLGDGLAAGWVNDFGNIFTKRVTTPGRTLVGASIEYGTFGRYLGLAVLGMTYLTNAQRYGLSVVHDSTTSSPPVPAPIDSARVNVVTVRALQPQVRLCAWRFQFALQLGVELRTGWIDALSSSMSSYDRGFAIVDLMASAHLSVRFNIAQGVFLFGSGNYTQYIYGLQPKGVGDTEKFRGSSTAGFNAGVGFGF